MRWNTLKERKRPILRFFRKPLAHLHSAQNIENVARVVDNLSRLCKEPGVQDALEEVWEQRDKPLDRNDAYLLLQECLRRKDFEYVRHVQFRMVQAGLDSIGALGDHLIRLFSICGLLIEATQAFDKIWQASVYSWSSIMLAYANLGQGQITLEFYSMMRQSGLENDRFIYLAVLKVCTTTLSLQEGRSIHHKVIEYGFNLDLVISNMLIDMYAKCGSLEESYKAFENSSVKNVISWSTMIAAYVQHGEGYLAFDCFAKMQQAGIKPNEVTILSMLKACSSKGAIEQGRLIHSVTRLQGLEMDVMTGTALVNMYAKSGNLEESQMVFEALPNQDVVAFNTMIAGYAQHAEGLIALRCYMEMQEKGIKPQNTTFSSIIKACESIRAIEWVRFIHNQIIDHGLALDIIVGNTLVDTYAKCGSLNESSSVFYKLPRRDIISWGAMIAGYAQQEAGLHALDCFEQMQQDGIEPNVVTLSSVLKACGSNGDIEKGRMIHHHILKEGLGLDTVMGSTLVDMYAKCGSLPESRKVFEGLENRNEVSWNALISGYAQHDNGLLALDIFDNMEGAGTNPDQVTFLSILKACGTTGALQQGRLIHEKILTGHLECDVVVGSALIDMYAKCGSLEDSRRVFESLSSQNTVSWNAMIAGFAQHGEGFNAIDCFERMQEEGINPEKCTLVSVLTACSRAGLADKGHWYFEHMEEHYQVVPEMDHYICMIDLLGRAGCLNEAEDLLQSTVQANISGWMCLLSASKMYKNTELGMRCFNEVVLLDPHCIPGHVLMSNIYADAHKEEM